MTTVAELKKVMEGYEGELDRLYEAVGGLTKLVGLLNTELAVVKGCMNIGVANGEVEKDWVPVFTVDPDAPQKVRYTVK